MQCGDPWRASARAPLKHQVAAAILAVVLAGASWSGQRKGRALTDTRGGFDLLAAPAAATLAGNRVACRVVGAEWCDRSSSWPAGSDSRYIFASGLQIAGRIPADAGFAWAGDTVGAFFFDGRGTQLHDTPLSPMVDSRASLLAPRPREARIRPGFPFDTAHTGRFAASEHDLWMRHWDGDPTLLSGRTHPMGIVVDVRAMAWGYPVGNDDVIYFVADLYNVSAADPAAYASLDPVTRVELAQVGRRFQDGVEAELGVALPDGGYRLDSVYVGLFMDADIEDASHNLSTAVLSFDASVAYKFDFTAPTWRFPAEIFADPFARAPGFTGAAFLATPAGVPAGLPPRLTLFTNFTGAATGFPHPVGVTQLWRYLSGRIAGASGDNPCTVTDPILSRLCYLRPTDADTRFLQSSGPFSLGPGERATVVLAYPFAAAVASGISIGVTNPVGIPPQPDSLVLGTDTLRTIDRAVGWVAHADRDGNGLIAGNEVETVPRSYLHKIQIAQAVMDAGFRLAAPPEAPSFFLVPGDGKVTVVWEPSVTERIGDPYAALAGDPTSPVFDPNFRPFDVEGYRVYRGASPDAMTLIAQFDYEGTSYVDRTGALDYGDCAPELGEFTRCPVTFDYPYTTTGPAREADLGGPLVQVRPGDRILLPGGGVHVLRADTLPILDNTGVPFAFVDTTVANAVPYWYAVTAFDVNSFASSPSSFESAPAPRSAMPRKIAAGVVGPTLTARVTGDDGQALNVAAPWPAINARTGTFAGPVPPGAGGRLDLAVSVDEALPAGDITVQVDSVGPGFIGGFGPPIPVYYLRMSAAGRVVRRSEVFAQPSFGVDSPREFRVVEPLVPYDSTLARRAGLDFRDTTTRMPVVFEGATTPISMTSVGIAVAVGRYSYGFGGSGPASRYLAHSRWFAEGGAEPDHPTITGYPDPSHHAGALPGVTRIWSPGAYRVPLTVVSPTFREVAAAAATAWYPADFVVTWAEGGGLAVRDVTHRIDLPFAAAGGSGWGFLTRANVLATGLDQAAWVARFADGVGTSAYDVISYQHLYLTHPGCATWWDAAEYCVDRAPVAELQPLDFDTDGIADGTGVVLIVNGEPFFLEMTALPAPGTQWRLRAITGLMTADCTPALGPAMTDCTNYTFEPHAHRPANVPGQRFTLTVQPAFTVDPNVSADLSRVHTVPDPYYVANALEFEGVPRLRFVNLPPRAILRIYSLSGVLVAVLTHDDPAGGGEVEWDLRSRSGRPVASGVYFFHLETPAGRQRVGRFTVLSAGR